MIKQIKHADEWVKPTVIEVENLMKLAGTNQGLNNWLDVHQLLGIKSRAFRRWKENADITPNSPSNITFWGYAALHAMAYKKPLVEPEFCNFHGVIDDDYIMNADSYICPPKSVLTSIIGKDALLKMTRGEIAGRIGMSGGSLSYQINDESISFATWSLILMLCGVPVEDIFYKGEKEREEVKSLRIAGELGVFELSEAQHSDFQISFGAFGFVYFNACDASITDYDKSSDGCGWELYIKSQGLSIRILLSKDNAALIIEKFPQIKAVSKSR
ncbi:hypothetical protein OAA_13815 [Vibrio cyclitrophicus 1F175]|uniref:hypothetical protein n=1 Tax=Vibrio TaxID=662 RepID=UPI0002E959FB|nr:hypothetical protein [Vibrio cyclitrophicus]OEF63558.1 hypothetical protein OAA_13815 [Vibrio cyclitrophicus 1F175]